MKSAQLNIKTSYPERFIYNAIKLYKPETEQQVQISLLGCQSFDIYVPSENTYINYNGYVFHEGKFKSIRTEQNDNDKRFASLYNHFRYIEVMEATSDDIDRFGRNLIESQMETGSDKILIDQNPSREALEHAANQILQEWGLEIQDVQAAYIEHLTRAEISMMRADREIVKTDKILYEIEFNSLLNLMNRYRAYTPEYLSVERKKAIISKKLHNQARKEASSMIETLNILKRSGGQQG